MYCKGSSIFKYLLTSINIGLRLLEVIPPATKQNFLFSKALIGKATYKAVLRYGIYLFVLSGFAYLLSALPKEEILFGILPVLAVTSVVLSPIFIDVSKYLKILEPLQYIYTVTYFAKADVMTMGIVAIVLNVVAFLVNRIVKR